MFEELFAEVERDLNVIAAGGTTARPPDWRKTKILNNEGGLLADARKFLEADWWKRAEPRDASNREILRMVERGQLRMGDGKEEEQNQYHVKGGTHMTAGEIAEHQRDREKAGVDDGEEWRTYLGSPESDAREWLASLAGKVDVNVAENKAWFATLKDHVNSKPQNARVEDLNQQLVELCVKNLCANL